MVEGFGLVVCLVYYEHIKFCAVSLTNLTFMTGFEFLLIWHNVNVYAVLK